MKRPALRATAAAAMLLAGAAACATAPTSTGRTNQAIAAAGPPVAVVLVLDLTESVRNGRWEMFAARHRPVSPGLPQLVAAARTLVSLLRADDEVALVTFADDVAVGVSATTDRNVVLAALDAAATSDPGAASVRSAVFDAVTAGITLASVRPDRSLVLLLSDALDGVSWFSVEDAADFARRARVGLDVVSVPATRDTEDFWSGLSGQNAIDILDHAAGQEFKASDRRLADRLRERLRLLRFSGSAAR